jgi:hypothetical protein
MTMSVSTSGPDLFNRLADEFAERYRRGERSPLFEYTELVPPADPSAARARARLGQSG